MKKLSIVLVLVIVGVSLWFVFGLLVGIYSVYTYPPSKEHPEGATLIVSRDEWEPMFNSPDYRAPERKQSTNQGSITFAKPAAPRRPIAVRTVVEFPYIEWAYRKSLEIERPEE
jgi:hypothetical protein